MKFDLYCSYNLSPTGFRRVEADLSSGTQREIYSDDGVVGKLMTVAGANSAFGCDLSSYYMVLKNIKAIDEEKSLDTPGRIWYVNFGVRADSGDLDSLCALIYFAYTDFDRFTDIIVNSLSVSDGNAPFLIDINSLNELSEESAKRFAKFEETKTAHFVSGPYGCTDEELSAAFELLSERKISKTYEFVIPEHDMKYFNEMFGSGRAHHSKAAGVKSNEKNGLLDDVHDFADNHRNEILVGSVAFGGLLCGYKVIKHIRRKKRKRKEFYA